MRAHQNDLLELRRPKQPLNSCWLRLRSTRRLGGTVHSVDTGETKARLVRACTYVQHTYEAKTLV